MDKPMEKSTDSRQSNLVSGNKVIVNDFQNPMAEVLR